MARIKNILKLNDWPIKSFLVVIFSIQLAYLGTFGMNRLGIEIPFLRQILGFVYIIFIPGYLLLRVLRIHKLDSDESFLYAVGLSLGLDIIVGFLINIFYPMLGLTSTPLSETSIILTFVSLTFGLSILAYFRDNNYHNLDFFYPRDIISPSFLFLSIVPFLAIFGTYMVNYYHTNSLLVMTIIVIALAVLLIGFTDLIPEKFYPYAVWVIGVALIWHMTLITPYVLVRDVAGEYYVARYCCEYRQFWDFSKQIFVNYNSVASVTILPCIFSKFAEISLNRIFKLVFPLIYSFMFVGVYLFHCTIFSRFFKDNKYKKHAFISVMILVFFVGTFRNVPVTTKQSIAEVFMILFVLYIHRKTNTNSRIFLILLVFSMIFSHYGTSLLMLGYLVSIMLLERTIQSNSPISNKLNLLVILFAVTFVIWYSHSSNSSIIFFIIGVTKRIFWGLHYFISTGKLVGSRGIYIIQQYNTTSILWTIYKVIHVIIGLYIVFGLITLLKLTYNSIKEPQQVLLFRYLFSVIYWGVIAGGTIVPYFSVMSPYRLFHIFLIFSAPLFVLGIQKTFQNKRNSLYVATLFGVILLLFSTELVFEITKTYSTSFSISQQTILSSGNIDQKILVYRSIMFTPDVESAKWSTKYIPAGTVYRFDSKKIEYIYGVIPYPFKVNDYVVNSEYPDAYYLHFTLPNIREKLGWSFYNIYYLSKPKRIKYSEYVIMENKIYTNSESEILWVS